MKKVNRLRKRMEQNKRYFIPSLVLLAAMGAGVYGTNNAGAQVGENQSSIIERMASKFNLNKDEVQKVFDEEREERQKLRQENMEKRLSDAVSRGELTENQKKLILDKKASLRKEAEARREEMQKNRENLGNMTENERKAFVEERQAEMKKHREEMETWAKNNGIDIKYLMGPMGERMGGPKGMHRNF
ncbi:MAG: hypothetical protein ACD_15C00113G0021 [uncultured bacterium]|nr:MAG: hypothetical protein ACD_15C00113G0021 [uncultured bacterium]